jgi:hypothetical protein
MLVGQGSLFQSRGGIVDIRHMDVAVRQRLARRIRWSRLGAVGLPIAVGAASFLVFVFIQVALARHYAGSMRAFCLRYQGTSGLDPTCRFFEQPSEIPSWLRAPYLGYETWSLVRFAAITALCCAIAAVGPRWAFWVPVVLWVVLPAVTGMGAYGDGVTAPNSVGLGWPRSVTWVGVGVEMTLVFLPPAAIAFSRQAARPRVDRRLAIGTFALCVAVFILWQATAATIYGDPTVNWTFDFARLLPLFVLGAFLGLSARTSLVLAGAAALYWFWWHTNVTSQDGLTLGSILPFASAVALGGAWRPLAVGLKRLEGRPWTLFWIANGLNVADAVITWSFLRSGQIQEANPFVRGIGLPTKVILVGLLTWLLVRARPRALVWPILVLAFVMAWDVAGVVLSRAMGVG